MINVKQYGIYDFLLGTHVFGKKEKMLTKDGKLIYFTFLNLKVSNCKKEVVIDEFDLKVYDTIYNLCQLKKKINSNSEITFDTLEIYSRLTTKENLTTELTAINLNRITNSIGKLMKMQLRVEYPTYYCCFMFFDALTWTEKIILLNFKEKEGKLKYIQYKFLEEPKMLTGKNIVQVDCFGYSKSYDKKEKKYKEKCSVFVGDELICKKKKCSFYVPKEQREEKKLKYATKNKYKQQNEEIEDWWKYLDSKGYISYNVAKNNYYQYKERKEL